jgi:alkyl hydroperoxide reductase subunit D
MAIVKPLSESEASEKIQQTLARVREMLGSDEVPAPFLLYARSPAFLQDFFMNSKRFVFSDGKLSAKTKALLALVVALVQKSAVWIDFLRDRCFALGWSDQNLADAAAVASTCTAYNAFFKFRDLADRDAFQGLPVGLRAHAFAGTSLDPSTAELVSVVVSTIHSCRACVSGHVAKALELGVDDEAVLEAVQCAATMASGTTFLAAG